MAAPGAATSAGESTSLSSEEMAAKAVNKRYEGLVMVRTKAIKGKGAWYWAHLEPILVNDSDTGMPKSVKLRCALCDAVFSASNPSRTASEHLKRGTCPNFSSPPKPISAVPAASPVSPAVVSASSQKARKRGSSSAASRGVGESSSDCDPPPTAFSAHHDPPPLAIVPSRFTVDLAYPPPVSVAHHGVTLASATASPSCTAGFFGQQLVLSGGKEDLVPLAKLEDSVKRLKSPKASPAQVLYKAQIETALDSLADWVFECCNSVSFSSLDHPQIHCFPRPRRIVLCIQPRIRRFEIGFQVRGSKGRVRGQNPRRDVLPDRIRRLEVHPLRSSSFHGGESRPLSLNLPNGATVFRRVVPTGGFVPSRYAEDILRDTITDICGNALHQCVGIVSDKFKSKALRSLENQHQWMVNLCCQHQGFISLIKDFTRELPLFKNVSENCLKLASFVNIRSHIRHALCKYQLQEYGRAIPIFLKSPFSAMVEDILSSARALQLVLLDESFKATAMEDSTAREIEEMMRNPHFWNELEAAHSLVKLVKTMAQEVKTEKPRVGQCLPLWEELKIKVRDWCSNFNVAEAPVGKVIEKRFKRNYHPAWAAAFILDPLYLIRDAAGKYLPPFKCLSPEQEKDVDKLITRLVSIEEAHVALMELMKWRTEGLDPVYAQAVQMKQRDPITGKMKIANPQSSRLVWETHLSDFKTLGRVAARLIFLHATTSCGFRCGSSLLRWAASNRMGMDKAQKLVLVAAHSKMEKRHEREEEAEIFALANVLRALNGLFGQLISL